MKGNVENGITYEGRVRSAGLSGSQALARSKNDFQYTRFVKCLILGITFEILYCFGSYRSGTMNINRGIETVARFASQNRGKEWNGEVMRISDMLHTVYISGCWLSLSLHYAFLYFRKKGGK